MSDETKVEETKEERSVRMAESRVPKCIEAIRKVAVLGGPNYHLAANQTDYIVETLTNEIVALRDAFAGKRTSVGFTLPQTVGEAALEQIEASLADDE